MGITPGLRTRLRLPLQHEDDDVEVDVGHEERLVQSSGRPGAVLPPAVGAGADDIGGIDDQDPGHVADPSRGSLLR
ncbi:hypothetical protein JCM18899A_19370 [Nocardioides sp. AN3]